MPKIDEYNLQRHQVEPLIEPVSPPPPPTTTYLTSAEPNHITQDWNWPSPFQRMGRSVGCDLPQHVAEKFSNKRFIFFIRNKWVEREKEADFCCFTAVRWIITHNQHGGMFEGGSRPKELHSTSSPAHSLH